jgi:hypothetical protein
MRPEVQDTRRSRRPERIPIDIDVISGKVISGKGRTVRRNLAIIALAFAVCTGGAVIRGSYMAGGRIAFAGGSENATIPVGADHERPPVTGYRNMNELLRSASLGGVDRQGGASGQFNAGGNIRKSASRDQMGKPNESGERQRTRAHEAARDRASPSFVGTARSDARQSRQSFTVLPRSYWTGASWRWRPNSSEGI